jgi:hypothetical protein
MVNYRLIEFPCHTLQLTGIACFIPFGNMAHSWMKGTENLSIRYFILSTLSFVIGFSLLRIAVIIIKRYYND